jgi:hypothetical protein
MIQDSLGWRKAGYGHELYDADRQVAFATSMNGLRGRQFYWRHGGNPPPLGRLVQRTL